MRRLSDFRVSYVTKEMINFLEYLVGQERLVVAELTKKLDASEVALQNANEKMAQMRARALTWVESAIEDLKKALKKTKE